MKKYYLKDNLIVRGDLSFYPKFIIYNIYTAESFEIDENLFKSLYIISTKKFNNALKEIGLNNFKILKKLSFISEKFSLNKPIIFSKRKFNVPVSFYPREIELHLNDNCNLSCKHCIYDIKIGKEKEYLRINKLFDFFDEAERLKIFRIIISGGEPFLRKDIDIIIKKLRTKKIRVEFLTNATLINEKIAKLLSCKKFSVNYSLDGYNEYENDYIRGKGVYNKVINSINILNKYKINHNLSCVISKINFNSYHKIIKLAEKLKSKSVNFIFLDIMGRAKNLQDIALNEKEILIFIKNIKAIDSKIKINFLNPLDIGKNSNNTNIISCSAGTYRVAIDAYGKVFPCVYAFNSKRFIMGDLNNKSLSKIWENKKWLLFRGKIKLSDLKVCYKCPFSSSCELKNCRLRPFFNNNDFYGPYPNCKYSILDKNRMSFK